MRKTGLIFMGVALALLLILPAIFYVLLLTESSFQIAFGNFLKEIYFSLVPGIGLIGLVFFFRDRLSAKAKDRFTFLDYFWFGLFTLSIALYITVYSAGADSVVRRMGYLIPSLSYISPEWSTFLLWFSFCVIVASSVMLYQSMQRLKWDNSRSGGIFIGLLLSLFFSLMLVRVPLVANLEEVFNSLKYSWLRNPAKSLHPATGLPYCQAPYDETGKKINAFAPNPPGVRDDIEIIGISNVTIEKVKGNWPLDWNIYANLARKMGGADGSLLLFDISFLDYKGVYGGSYCGILFECTPLAGKGSMRPQSEVLAEALASNHQKVISDYPLETTDEARSTIPNYQERLNLLNRKELLHNVKHGGLAIPFAKLPLPPIESVINNLKGIGYANILKSESGVNFQVPIVARIPNTDRAGQPNYNPDRDDFFYPGIDLVTVSQYYGVDPARDVEVDFLAGYVKIKNIPRRTYTKLETTSLEMKEYDIMAKPNKEREIVIPIDQAGRMNINFRGGRYCFKYRELLETTEMTADEIGAYYKGKVALVAMYYATGVGTAKDIHLSPYGDMAGIEHHASAINTILNQDFARNAPNWVNLMILLAVGLIMGLYQPRVATWMSFVLAVVIAFVFEMMTLFVTFDMLSYQHVFPTVLVLQFFQLVAFIGFRALTEEENVKFIRTTFSKFVSHDVVEELLAHPEAIQLGGSKKEISVFFSDVRGFTTISEALSPEGLVQLLNEYLSEMTELIIDYRGTIDKYMGDAIMAFWGAPAKNDDHAYYACVAAIAQRNALKDLQKRWSERNIPVLDIGIGLNTGLAVVGNMGSSRRMDYTLMGDTVNLGSRLEGITKTYGVKICISEFTYEHVKDRVYARELDLVRVKGKLEPVRIYELMGLVNESDLESLKTSHQAVRH